MTRQDVSSSIVPMPVEARDKILSKARGLLRTGGNPTVAQLAAAAGVSRTSFYREFESREALLEALDLQPEPGARERILEAALTLVGAHGLNALSMDDLATQAEVSRATLYRLFPGKAALFTNLVHAFSPLDPVTELLKTRQDEPPDVLMPEIARTVYRTFYGAGENRVGVLRALFFEISTLSPDTAEGAQDAIRGLVGSLVFYLMSQMRDGQLRQMPPLLVLQSFVGPIFFHLLTRQLAERLLGLDIDGEQAVTMLAESWLRAMMPEEATP
ncbi:MAG TPA: TetR/AcrR family transcriptional regulator [Candidatus Dormibacteraeota bacterium]|nr:TetR/AcrR family transcriptional regulator [Candidatus Dormibacteraeota bacterium]